MTLHGNLTALMCALALVLGLAACSGGDSSGPDKAAQQRTAVETAIRAATSGLLRLPDDASEEQLEDAADAVAAARKALTDADALADDDKGRFETDISDLEESLERARARIADARDTRRRTTTEEARKITAALSGVRITAVAAAVRHGAAPVMSGTAPGTPPVSVAELETRPDGGAVTVQGWSTGRYTAADADAGIEDTVVLYTNVAPPGSRPFSGEGGKYGAGVLDADGNLPILRAPMDAAPATDTTLIAAAGFPTGPGLRTHEPGPGGAVVVEGSFDGAPGNFLCTPTAQSACQSSVKDGGGYVLSGGGGWKFVPNQGAQVPEPDGEHQYFGWWLRDVDGVYAVGAFHGGHGGATDELANLAALQGTATYAGPAAGQFALQPQGGEAEAGAFRATATLKVDFGDGTETGIVTGEVSDFTVGGAAKDWSIELGSAAIGTHGTIASGGSHTALTRWTVNDDTASATGTWSGRFHEADLDSTPTVATGMFDAAHGTIGRMTGAFGTTRQPQ